MQKSKIATIGIIIIIAIYAVFSSVYLSIQHNATYLYIINPLFYIILSILLRITCGKTYEKNKIKKEIFTCSVVGTLIYIIVYLVMGLFVTFGKNPYSTDIKGIVINLWILGSVIFFKEYIRYKLINNVYDKDKIKIAFLISIIYIFIDTEIYRHFLFPLSALNTIKYISQTVIPIIIKNILFSYIYLNANMKPVLIYELLTKIYIWTSPILPNSPWIVNAIVEIVIPMMMYLYIMFIKNKKIGFKVKEELAADPRSYIPFIIILILIILFSVGIFTYQPVAVATGSMEKEIFIGDVVIIKKCTANDIIEGDVIQYRLKDYTVIHRVVKKEQKQGDIYFITKGDNNRQIDIQPVTKDQVIGKVVLKIRYLGYPAVWLNLAQANDKVEVETGN